MDESLNQPSSVKAVSYTHLDVYKRQVFVCFSGDIVSLFLPDRTSHAWQYAVAGLPLFAVDYIFFGINVIDVYKRQVQTDSV